MVKENVFGYRMPEFYRTEGKESMVADLIAKSEDDFELWLKYAIFPKSTGKERGSLTVVDDKPVLIVREPRTGSRRAVYVETPKFLNEVHDYLSLIGSRSLREKMRR